jgi:hypothetical protein
MLVRAHSEATRERHTIVSKLRDQQEELEMQVTRAQSEREALAERSSQLQVMSQTCERARKRSTFTRRCVRARLQEAQQRQLELSSKQLKAATSAAAAKAAKAAVEDPAKVSGNRSAAAGAVTRATKQMDPKQKARLDSLKGKYGTHVASNMKKQALKAE